MSERVVLPARRSAASPADSTLAALADIAAGGLAEQLRIEAAARVVALARRSADLAARGLLPRTAGESVVDAIASRWDPTVVTAIEFAELLTPAERDLLLAAAPAWAAARLPQETRRAA
jgi:hypothetical protein